jgi:hypothetical protein
MSFFRTCRTFHDYECDNFFDPVPTNGISLAAAAPLIRGTVRQTFVALRLREGMAPYLKFLLNKNNFDKLIADETDNFFGNDEFEIYDIAFHDVLETDAYPMRIIFDNDNVLRYMIGNINLSSPMLADVSEVNHL